MKTYKKLALVAFAAMAATAASAQVAVPDHPIELNTPGIVLSGSSNAASLPNAAKEFIAKYFPGTSVVKCEQFFAKGKIEVELNTGVDIDFDTKGNVMEVEAPDNMALPREVVKKLLHETAFARLVAAGHDSKVESIEIKRGRVVEVNVDIPDPDTYIFDVNGAFIALED